MNYFPKFEWNFQTNFKMFWTFPEFMNKLWNSRIFFKNTFWICQFFSKQEQCFHRNIYWKHKLFWTLWTYFDTKNNFENAKQIWKHFFEYVNKIWKLENFLKTLNNFLEMRTNYETSNNFWKIWIFFGNANKFRIFWSFFWNLERKGGEHAYVIIDVILTTFTP